jgi:signal transduction histidine kinase
MTDDSHALAIEGIRFFGEISASISHEIKNVLAIINENAGLLQDMIMMNEKGLPLNPERLSKLAHSISGQVARATGSSRA